MLVALPGAAMTHFLARTALVLLAGTALGVGVATTDAFAQPLLDIRRPRPERKWTSSPAQVSHRPRLHRAPGRHRRSPTKTRDQRRGVAGNASKPPAPRARRRRTRTRPRRRRQSKLQRARRPPAGLSTSWSATPVLKKFGVSVAAEGGERPGPQQRIPRPQADVPGAGGVEDEAPRPSATRGRRGRSRRPMGDGPSAGAAVITIRRPAGYHPPGRH